MASAPSTPPAEVLEIDKRCLTDDTGKDSSFVRAIQRGLNDALRLTGQQNAALGSSSG